jgi:hypothetical protein
VVAGAVGGLLHDHVRRERGQAEQAEDALVRGCRQGHRAGRPARGVRGALAQAGGLAELLDPLHAHDLAQLGEVDRGHLQPCGAGGEGVLEALADQP